MLACSSSAARRRLLSVSAWLARLLLLLLVSLLLGGDASSSALNFLVLNSSLVGSAIVFAQLLRLCEVVDVGAPTWLQRARKKKKK